MLGTPTPKAAKSSWASNKKPKPGAPQGITSEHLPKGAMVESKKGHKGVVTGNHMTGSAVLLKDPGKKYHVAWSSVTKVNGKDAADVVAKQAARSGKGPGYSDVAGKPKSL